MQRLIDLEPNKLGECFFQNATLQPVRQGGHIYSHNHPALTAGLDSHLPGLLDMFRHPWSNVECVTAANGTSNTTIQFSLGTWKQQTTK